MIYMDSLENERILLLPDKPERSGKSILRRYSPLLVTGLLLATVVIGVVTIRKGNTSSSSSSSSSSLSRSSASISVASGTDIIKAYDDVADSKAENEFHRASITDIEQDFTGDINSHAEFYENAVVASDTYSCADVGRDLIRDKGAGAADAAIATLICTGLQNAESTGLGGGAFYVIYDTPRGGTQKEMVSMVGREKAPLASNIHMFNEGKIDSQEGGMSIAVPGEVKGYYEIWKRFGRVAWRDLFQPSIDMARKGFKVSKHMASALQRLPNVRKNPWSSIYIMPDGRIAREGDTIYMPVMATTLERIAQDPHTFYNGSLARDIVRELKLAGSIITMEDLASYSADWKATVATKLKSKGWTMHSSPPPSGGALLQFILRIIDGMNFTQNSISTVEKAGLTYHRIIETDKFTYALRSYVCDPDYCDTTKLMRNLTSDAFTNSIRRKIDDSRTYPIEHYGADFEYADDGGTVHLAVLGADGSAVSVTGTIDLEYGARVMGKKTGIVYNCQMDDFSIPGKSNYYGVPPSEENFIVPGKRPASSTSPTIMIDEQGRVKMVIGGSGGTRITANAAFVAVNNLYFGRTLKEAVATPRLYHQLSPNVIQYEHNFPQSVLEELKKKGHEMITMFPLGVVQAIKNYCDEGCENGLCLEGVSDGRKGGRPSGF